jgi:LuxR family maltose regulon positive regulatory protein
LQGRREQAERWLEAGTRGTVRGPLPDGSSSVRPWIALMRAWLCREGAKQMLADAKTAVAGLARESNWRPGALVAQGAALMMLDHDEEADGVFAAAAECAAEHGWVETQILALGERALLAADRGDHSAADAHSEQVHRLVVSLEPEGRPARTMEHAATARMLLRHGRWNEARTSLEAARELIPFVNLAMPWLAVQLRIELIRGLITLRDTGPAQELLDETADFLKQAPGLGVLTARTEKLQQEVALIPEREGIHHGGLTPAELRLLPLLATHLSFREIADQLYVSRNTIKTQAISVYRKLGVSSRSDAIAEARRLGLGEHLQVVISNER